jgi:hypothetical protein
MRIDMNEQTKFALDLIKNTQAKSVLNIGYRHDSDDLIQKYCNNNNIEFVVLEIFAQNCENILNIRKLPCIHGDVRNIKNMQIPNFDVIQWLHGPEHIYWDEFLTCRLDIEAKANKAVLYQAPIGEYPQDAMYNNIYEKHLTTLLPRMFEELDYEMFLHDKNGESTFSALRTK